MILTNNKKSDSESVIILKCHTIIGDEIIYISERVAYNSLSHLDTTNTPLRCYRIVNPSSNILIRTFNEDLSHLHLNQLLSYTNISKKYAVLSQHEFDSLTENTCQSCALYKDSKCTSAYIKDGVSCLNIQKKRRWSFPSLLKQFASKKISS